MPTWDHVFAFKSTDYKKKYEVLWSNNYYEFYENAKKNQCEYFLIQANDESETNLLNLVRSKHKLISKFDPKTIKYNLNDISMGTFYLFKI